MKNFGKPRRPPLTYEQKVKRIYPSALMCEDHAEKTYNIMAMNGTGNIIGSSLLDPLDAWKRAAAAVEPPRGPTR